MKKQVLLLCALALFLAVGCGADKNSNEACLYETTMNLDKGSYDAVLASSCADSMQKGAAHFGKAGYDVTNVINNFSSTGSASAPGSQSDLNVYLTKLTSDVNEETLLYLSKAKVAYTDYVTIENPDRMSDSHKDAQFYLSIVEAVNSLSLLKTVADSTGIGSLDTDCDINLNSVPDELDAMSCALLNGVGCASGVVTAFATNIATPLKFTGKDGEYRGMEFMVNGGGDPASCSATNYRKLLTNSANAMVVTLNPTSDGMCVDTSSNNSGSWPCPYEQGTPGAPLDLVTELQESIDSAIIAMGSALPAGTSADVQQSISDIRKDACSTDLICTSSDLANYLQTF